MKYSHISGVCHICFTRSFAQLLRTHKHTYTHVHTHTHKYTHILTHTHTYSYTHTRTYPLHIYTYTYTYTHVYIHCRRATAPARGPTHERPHTHAYKRGSTRAIPQNPQHTARLAHPACAAASARPAARASCFACRLCRWHLDTSICSSDGTPLGACTPHAARGVSVCVYAGWCVCVRVNGCVSMGMCCLFCCNNYLMSEMLLEG